MAMTRRKKIALATLGGLIALQVGTYLLFASYTIPSIALRLTPEHTHFAKGTTFSWVWLQTECCGNLTDNQKARLRSALGGRYRKVYDAEAEIPRNLIERCSDGTWRGYNGGFAYSFGVISRGPFWAKVRHHDSVGNLAASSGEHVYVWFLFMWVKLYDGPMDVS